VLALLLMMLTVALKAFGTSWSTDWLAMETLVTAASVLAVQEPLVSYR
jgi:hypothetical protein